MKLLVCSEHEAMSLLINDVHGLARLQVAGVNDDRLDEKYRAPLLNLNQ
jgi:hypothetical protein